MSVGAASPQVAVLGTGGQRVVASRAGARPVVRLITFGALALYGTLRWSTLISGGASRPLFGLFLLAMLVAGGRSLVAKLNRVLAALGTAAVLVAAFAVAGVPLTWILHLRIAVTANAIGEGLSALPQVLVPYAGVNQWVRLVIVLGAAVLLFDSALLVAFAPRAMEDLRRAGAALPLVALVAVPDALVRPRSPYLDGALLFALLAAFAWGERVGGRRMGGAIAACSLAAILAIIAAPALDLHKPWLDPHTFAGSFAPTAVDTFDWTQSYGPIDWPRRGHVVLEIQAKRPEYWKAENLDVFNGQAWTGGVVPGAGAIPGPSSGALSRWSEPIQVTVRDMKIPDVIGAGTSQAPKGIGQPVAQGISPGTWTAGSNLAPGDSYKLTVYTPHPAAAALNAAGSDYTGVPPGYLTILLPAGSVPGLAATAASLQIVFPPFHSAAPVQNLIGLPITSGERIIEASPYASAYQLARRLAGVSSTPYEFAAAVELWLANGYTYNEDPPRGAYPLERFLFGSRLGYCQQFAGAMALLLRMGGVPARVAVGFTSGHRDSATHRWLVSDLDAHAWVEAWFPRYGWVQFDPTPNADPALGGSPPLISNPALAGAGKAPHPTKHRDTTAAATPKAAPHRARHGRGGGGLTALALAGAAVAALLALVLLVTRPPGSADALVAELERAMRRAGRRLPGGATLVWLEHRVSGSSEAAAYVRALRRARFGGGPELPTREQRRALRRHLRSGLGVLGPLRAMWALPPKRIPAGTRAQRKRDA